MKVLLVNPANGSRTIGGDGFFMYEPLALEYLAAGVTADHDVQILDLRLEPDLVAALAAFGPDLVGITAYTVHVEVVKGLFGKIRAWNPAVVTVVGGHHATVSPKDFCVDAIDWIVQGEGVAPFRELARRVEAGGRAPTPAAIPGVIDARNPPSVPFAPDASMDLDACPLPDRSLTAKYRASYFCDWMQPLASIRTSKGCPFRCNFCALWKLTGGRYRTRAPESIVEELGQIEEEHVFFADDESLVSARRMHELAARIKASGIRKRYFLYGRSDTICKHPDLLEAWRDIGLERVFVGFESFRDADLLSIRKRATVKENERAVAILASMGVDVYASFMVRHDYDRDDFRAFARYVRGLPLNYVTFSVLTPLPGTDLYAEVADDLVIRDFERFDFMHPLLPTKLPVREYYRELLRLYRTAVPLKRSLQLLSKFPLRRIPSCVAATSRVLRQLKRAHRDYPDAAEPAASRIPSAIA